MSIGSFYAEWALLIGESRAVVIARLVEEEAGRRGTPMAPTMKENDDG